MEFQGKVTLENILLGFSKSLKLAFRVVENGKNRHFLTKLFFCNNPRTFKASFPYTSSPHCVVYYKTEKLVLDPRPESYDSYRIHRKIEMLKKSNS